MKDFAREQHTKVPEGAVKGASRVPQVVDAHLRAMACQVRNDKDFTALKGT
jgi:hypothetical protein